MNWKGNAKNLWVKKYSDYLLLFKYTTPRHPFIFESNTFPYNDVKKVKYNSSV